MKASSESGECASLISTGSFSVLEAVCWPGMGVSVSFSRSTPTRPGHFAYNREAVAWPLLWFFPERLSRPGEGPSESNGRKRARRRGLRGAGPGDFLQGKPSILASGEQLEGALGAEANRGPRTLQRRNHAGDGVVEGDAAVKVRLPKFLEQLEVVAPATLVEAFAHGVGNVAAVGGVAVLVTGGGARRAKHRADDFTGGVEDQSVPEVTRDGFVALAALANDGGLHRLGDTVRTFMEKNFQGRRALIARVQAGDGDPQGIGGGVGTGPVGVAREVDADFLSRPARQVNIRKPFRESHALLAHERGHAHDPVAVGAIVPWPQMCAIDGRGRFQNLRQLRRQACVAELSLPPREFIAILKIPELIFQLDEFG